MTVRVTVPLAGASGWHGACPYSSGRRAGAGADTKRRVPADRTIGNIYCITVSAVQHRKLKLKKDVFGESNPDVTLEKILNSK